MFDIGFVMKAIVRYKNRPNDEEISLKEAQKHLTWVLKQFQHFCEDNDIRFCLTYGSLIGAAREHEIIKWDDDIDLMMDENSIKKMMSVIDRLSNYGLKYYHYTNCTGCYTNEIRIYADGYYRVLYENGKKFITPLCIDIFLASAIYFDEKRETISKNKSEMVKIARAKKLLMYKNARYDSKNRFSLFARRLTRFFLLPVSSKRLHKRIDKIVSKMAADKKEFKYLYSPYACQTPYTLFKEDLLDNFVKLDFCDSYSYGPKDYDYFLTLHYGNWKKPVDRSSGAVYKNIFLKRKRL